MKYKYILVRVGISGTRSNVRAFDKKKLLVEYLKSEGYYFSKKVGRYINDRTVKLKYSNYPDYEIERVKSV